MLHQGTAGGQANMIHKPNIPVPYQRHSCNAHTPTCTLILCCAGSQTTARAAEYCQIYNNTISTRLSWSKNGSLHTSNTTCMSCAADMTAGRHVSSTTYAQLRSEQQCVHIFTWHFKAYKRKCTSANIKPTKSVRCKGIPDVGRCVSKCVARNVRYFHPKIRGRVKHR